MNIVIAGVEKKYFARAALLSGTKWGLFSFYHFSKESESNRAEVIEMFNRFKTNIIIDSGLFTFMFGAEKGRKYDLDFMRQYTANYISEVKKYQIERMTIVESDVHKILGMDAVFELRKLFTDSGIDTIFVWHVEEGIEGLMRLAEERNYIAISVPELRKVFTGKNTRYQEAVFDLLYKVVRHCKTRGIRVPKIHLLGNTIQQTMETRLAYSCDSTSWTSGVRYGNTIMFDGVSKLIKVHIRSRVWKAYKLSLLQEFSSEISEINSHCKTEQAFEYMQNIFAAAVSYNKYQAYLDKNFRWIGEHK